MAYFKKQTVTKIVVAEIGITVRVENFCVHRRAVNKFNRCALSSDLRMNMKNRIQMFERIDSYKILFRA